MPMEPADPLARQLLISEIDRETRERIDALRAQTEATEAKGKAMAIDAELTKGLAGVEFVSEGAKRDAIALLRNDLRVYSEDSGYNVRGPAWQTAAEHVQQRLADPSWAHFLEKPASTPSTPKPSAATPASPESAAPEPQGGKAWQQPGESLGMAFVRRHQAAQAAREAPGDARMNMALPFGLPGRK